VLASRSWTLVESLRCEQREEQRIQCSERSGSCVGWAEYC
jgi:hypothetical protein